MAVFQKDSPLHDGAVIVDGDQLTQAGGILPLTQRRVPDHYGTRHRAGVGLTERSDASVVVVSEERGEVTLMREGRTDVMPGVDSLVSALTADAPAGSRKSSQVISRLRLTGGVVAASLALSALVWSAMFLLPGRSVRVQTSRCSIHERAERPRDRRAVGRQSAGLAQGHGFHFRFGETCRSRGAVRSRTRACRRERRPPRCRHLRGTTRRQGGRPCTSRSSRHVDGFEAVAPQVRATVAVRRVRVFR